MFVEIRALSEPGNYRNGEGFTLLRPLWGIVVGKVGSMASKWGNRLPIWGKSGDRTFFVKIVVHFCKFNKIHVCLFFAN